jgi:hypothetical protein
LKKPLALVMLAGLMLAGCTGKQASAQSAATPTATAVAVAPAASITVPAVIGTTLDKATDQFQGLGLKVQATDADNGKTIVLKSNWQVISQDPGQGTQITKGSTVKLGVRHLTDPTPTPTPTPVKLVEAPPAPPAAPPVVVDPPAYIAPRAPPVVVNPPPVYGGIICKDGYAWPGTTRQGACHGHGGIRN